MPAGKHVTLKLNNIIFKAITKSYSKDTSSDYRSFFSIRVFFHGH